MTKLLRAPLYCALALLIYTPFHVFFAQWLSTLTGGLDAWKAGKDVFLVVALVLTYGLLIYKRRFSERSFWILTIGTMTYFAIHLLVWAANPGIDTDAALLGTAYNCRLFGYVLLAWGAIILFPGKFPIKKAFKIALVVASVVALLGIVQFLLPKDLMTHFGYSFDRGARPAFFIDEKPDLPRIMSTIRDPNSLGAFLILPLTVLTIAWVKIRSARILLSGMTLLCGLALFLTFSRSAWLGTLLALSLAHSWIFRKEISRFIKKYASVIAAVIILLLAGLYGLRDQYFVQNVVFHSDESTKMADPNELRVGFLHKVSDKIIDQPFGHGPGTAGLVSIQTKKVVLTENYFLQIGYEIGLQGLVLLMTLLAFILKLLFDARSVYSKVLVAAFVGISVSAMLIHTWSNEAVAAQWWLLAGFLLGSASILDKKHKKIDYHHK